MKKLAIVSLLLLAICVSAQTITVTFQLPSPPAGDRDDEGWHWVHTWDGPSSSWDNWAEQIIVNVYEDGELIDSRQFQRHQNSESDINTLASEATELYTQLNAQEAVVNDLYSRVGSAMGDSQYQDKAYSQLTEDLVEDKKIYDEILYQVQVKMDEVKTEEGSGNLGWYYYN